MHTQEFKEMILNSIEKDGMTRKALSKQYRISRNTIYLWFKARDAAKDSNASAS